jgi:hypothetical protein
MEGVPESKAKKNGSAPEMMMAQAAGKPAPAPREPQMKREMAEAVDDAVEDQDALADRADALEAVEKGVAGGRAAGWRRGLAGGVGGGQALDLLARKSANRASSAPTTVSTFSWQPLLITDAEGRAEVTLEAPLDAIELRILVDGHADGRIGSVDATLDASPTGAQP